MRPGADEPPLVVLCGVAGAGKTTVGRLVAARLGVPFADADAFHAPDAVEKMTRGIPLTDDDRAPWLARLGKQLRRWHAQGTGGVLACSALRPAYRAQLADGLPALRFVLLTASEATLATRLARRPGHFFPAALLGSQLDALDAAGVPSVSTDDRTPAATAAAVLALL